MLREALQHVRNGRLDEAQASSSKLVGSARLRLELAIALAHHDSARAIEIAASLWTACDVDPTVLAVLVHFGHPDLREGASDLLVRWTREATADLSQAWSTLAREPGSRAAWRDVLATLIATGREIDAVDGVARALAEHRVDFEVFALLASTLLVYRRRAGALAMIALGRRAFPGALEVHAIATLVHLGLGELERAMEQYEFIKNRSSAHPLIIAARRAMAGAVQ